MTHDKAVVFAEAAANKDFPGAAPPGVLAATLEQPSYHSLCLNEKGELFWEAVTHPSRRKNIFQILIHDADCLEIIRVGAMFNYSFLDFHRYCAHKSVEAFSDMAQLVIEVRSFMKLQEDNVALKLKYEKAEAMLRRKNY